MLHRATARATIFRSSHAEKRRRPLAWVGTAQWPICVAVSYSHALHRGHRSEPLAVRRRRGRTGLGSQRYEYRAASAPSYTAARWRGTIGAPEAPLGEGTYDAVFAASMADPAAFWTRAARDISWSVPPSEDGALTATDTAPYYRWFAGAKTNACENAVDVHVAAGRGDQPAIIYESMVGGRSRSITYSELLGDVVAFASVLRARGVQAGDRVLLYMPMVPETMVAMLACARLGAIHSVVFGGFASHELAVRIDDARPKVVVSASCGLEGADKTLAYKPLLDEALRMAEHRVDSCIVLQREQLEATLEPGRDESWSVACAADGSDDVAAVQVDSTHPLYILYTSGSTGKPKGVVRDTGGHITMLKWTMRNIYNCDEGDVYMAGSDLGWVVGHSYIAYAPLLRGSTTVLFEGKPVGTPDAGTYWRVVRKHGVRVLFTAPTALRAIRREDPDGKFLEGGLGPRFDSLWLAGERSDPTTIEWCLRHVGSALDHSWMTESGSPMIANCRGLGQLPVKPGSATKPVPGWDVRVLRADTTDDGRERAADARGDPEPAGINELGAIVAKLPLPPGALAGLWEDPERCEAYFSRWPGYFETGDAGVVDEDGYLHVMARTDDVINTAGHRLSTGAIEAAIASLPEVAEVAIIGAADALKGSVPISLIVLKAGVTKSPDEVVADSIAVVRQEIGAVASYKQGAIVARLPKTRSGKVLRGTLRSIADGVAYKQPATIDDPATLDEAAAALRTIGYAQPRQPQA